MPKQNSRRQVNDWVDRRTGARSFTNNLVIGIEARRRRITERLIECETFPRR